jgi:hypothetical protein
VIRTCWLSSCPKQSHICNGRLVSSGEQITVDGSGCWMCYWKEIEESGLTVRKPGSVSHVWHVSGVAACAPHIRGHMTSLPFWEDTHHTQWGLNRGSTLLTVICLWSIWRILRPKQWKKWTQYNRGACEKCVPWQDTCKKCVSSSKGWG